MENMKPRMSGKNGMKGSLTVEATLILPFIFITWLYIINFLNIYLIHATVQQALNNTAKRVSEYTYLLERTNVTSSLQDVFAKTDDTIKKGNDLRNNAEDAYNYGKETYENSKQIIKTAKSTAESAEAVYHNSAELLNGATGSGDFSAKVESITENAKTVVTNLTSGDLSFANIKSKVIDPAKSFGESVKATYEVLKSINGDNVKDYFLSELTNAGGGLLIGAFFNIYIDGLSMRTQDISYMNFAGSKFFYGKANNSMALIATYTYTNPFSIRFLPGFTKSQIRQTCVMNMWIGDENKDIRKLKDK